MSLTQSIASPSPLALPTGWLASPPGLVPSTQPVKIEPIPIAIVVTIVCIISAIVVFFLARKDKELFLEDRIIHAPRNQESAAGAGHGGTNDRTPVAVKPHAVQDPPPALGNPARQQPGSQQAPKASAMLGMGGHNWQPETSNIEPAQYQQVRDDKEYYGPDYESDDDETLNDYEKDSAYWPPPRSDASEGYDKEMGRLRYSGRPRLSDGSVRRSAFEPTSKTRLGDAY
jgi:hypothetical protein